MKAEIATLALKSRLLVICLQCVANLVLPDHDAGVFNPPLADERHFTVADKVVMFFLGGFRRWDAVYFLHIAEHGYTYENCVAFFPLYPLVVSTVKLVSFLFPCLSTVSLLLVCGVVVNVALFTVTAVVLLQLGCMVTHDSHLSYLAAVLFCINPASVFMTAPYTETLFACLSFAGMLCISQRRLFMGAVLIGASALTRSNGVVSVGFFLHYLAADYVQYIVMSNRDHRKTMPVLIVRVVEKVVVIVIKAVMLLFISFLPFVLFQWYIYELFCFPENHSTRVIHPAVVGYSHKEGFKLVGKGPVSPWCQDSLPLSYSYIQAHHWGVGFMRYYQLKQIPNFVLAMPVIALSLCACFSFYCHRPQVCHTLGLVTMGRYKVETVGGCEEGGRRSGWCSAPIVVYVLHLLFLTCFGCCFMHIQVLTRFLCSASPVIYWFAAYIMYEQNVSKTSNDSSCCPSEKYSLLDLLSLHKHCSAQGKLVLGFFWGYFVIGTVAFSNFLPWT